METKKPTKRAWITRILLKNGGTLSTPQMMKEYGGRANTLRVHLDRMRSKGLLRRKKGTYIVTWSICPGAEKRLKRILEIYYPGESYDFPKT